MFHLLLLNWQTHLMKLLNVTLVFTVVLQLAGCPAQSEPSSDGASLRLRNVSGFSVSVALQIDETNLTIDLADGESNEERLVPCPLNVRLVAVTLMDGISSQVTNFDPAQAKIERGFNYHCDDTVIVEISPVATTLSSEAR